MLHSYTDAAVLQHVDVSDWRCPLNKRHHQPAANARFFTFNKQLLVRLTAAFFRCRKSILCVTLERDNGDAIFGSASQDFNKEQCFDRDWLISALILIIECVFSFLHFFGVCCDVEV